MRQLRAILIGAQGRMGRAVAEIAAKENVTIVAASEAAEVLIDFSAASATGEICEKALAQKLPVVIGTTGHDGKQQDEIARVAKVVPVVLASNFSVGVNVLFWLTEQAAKALGDKVDFEIVEAHHRWKKDAPSGTAKALAEILQKSRGQKNWRHGREGMIGARGTEEIGIHSIRGGDIVGEHTVILAGDGERLELTHRAASRETFARGALRAARWVVGQPPRIYSMRDVLGL